jgi:hypothetical protein
MSTGPAETASLDPARDEMKSGSGLDCNSSLKGHESC